VMKRPIEPKNTPRPAAPSGAVVVLPPGSANPGPDPPHTVVVAMVWTVEPERILA
jgi:hypothetical protein